MLVSLLNTYLARLIAINERQKEVMYGQIQENYDTGCMLTSLLPAVLKILSASLLLHRVPTKSITDFYISTASNNGQSSPSAKCASAANCTRQILLFNTSTVCLDDTFLYTNLLNFLFCCINYIF
jgi:hypothetical protein